MPMRNPTPPLLSMSIKCSLTQKPEFLKQDTENAVPSQTRLVGALWRALPSHRSSERTAEPMVPRNGPQEGTCKSEKRTF